MTARDHSADERGGVLSEADREALYLPITQMRLSINDCGVLCDALVPVVERLLTAARAEALEQAAALVGQWEQAAKQERVDAEHAKDRYEKGHRIGRATAFERAARQARALVEREGEG